MFHSMGCHMYVSKLKKNKRVFIYPAQNIQIQCRIYKFSQVYIYPAQDLYIQHRIYKSSQGFIYPARDLYIPCWIYKYPFIFLILRHMAPHMRGPQMHRTPFRFLELRNSHYSGLSSTTSLSSLVFRPHAAFVEIAF